MESSQVIVPVRKLSRRPCACCGQHKSTGVVRFGRWRPFRNSTPSEVCRQCSDKLGFALRLESLVERVRHRAAVLECELITGGAAA